MTEYIIKMILCSATFILLYFLLLQKEKMYRFNRFYLLFSFVFSLLIPFITINVETRTSFETVGNYILVPVDNLTESTSLQNVKPVENLISIYQLLLLAYWIITFTSLIRFGRNLFKMYLKIKERKCIFYKGSKLILIEENLTPHSFLNWIFLNKTLFEKGDIEEEILFHEFTHIKQHHTIDALLIELASVFLWFNPFVFLYRKAIKLNHEFLADQGVINRFQNIQAYQYLLIDKTSQQQALSITSQFNFLITKKRLIMITRHTSVKTAILKQCLCVAVFLGALLLFSSKETVAQIIHDTTSTTHKNTVVKKEMTNTPLGQFAGGTKEGVSEKELKVYQYLAEKIRTADKPQKEFLKEKMETIFKKMNVKQQRAQNVWFLKPTPPLPRIIPTQKQFTAFKNGKIYGVWINGKKVNNSSLNNYTREDFAQCYVSKLYGPAKKGKSYSYQVNLMTKDYYQDYYGRAIKDTSSSMAFRSLKPIKK